MQHSAWGVLIFRFGKKYESAAYDMYTLRSVLLYGDHWKGGTVALHLLWLEAIQDRCLVARWSVENGIALLM